MGDQMRKSFAALAFAVVPVQPADAITFSKLTTIYVGSGVFDSGDATGSGVATVIHCSNVSGVSTNVRVLVLNMIGDVEGALTQTLLHGETRTFSTHATSLFVDDGLNTGAVAQGVVNVEATNSAVFCTAMIVDAAATVPNGIDLHLVRVNPHPGTVE
jgi:hypothetical protein